MFIASFVLFFVAACFPVGENKEYKLPPQWKMLVAPGNNITLVAPVVMEDGTQCYVVLGNNAGRGIFCK